MIASTLDDAFNTGDIIVKDWEDNVKFNENDGEGFAGVQREMKKRNVRPVSWQQWLKIDAEEKRRGKEKGKVREKCRSVAEMLSILDS